MGRIRFINYSVFGEGGTSESDVTLVPKTGAFISDCARFIAWRAPLQDSLADSVWFVSEASLSVMSMVNN